MTYLPHHVSEPDVIEALSSVLHKPPISFAARKYFPFSCAQNSANDPVPPTERQPSTSP